jgi:aryl-alcohol dehydrogenase-like predicted oxidoreductase
MSFSTDAQSHFPLVLGGNVFGWTADRTASFAVLDAFADAGGSQVDTADAYSAWLPGNSGGESETIIGEWLARSRKRDQVFIATKVGSLAGLGNLKATTIATAVEASLRRLQSDYIDLYWAHRDDENTPQDETLTAFDALVRAGKVRYLGASNFSAERLESALKVSETYGLARYVAIQPLYNLLEHAEFEAGPGQVAAAHNLATLPYSGLASGFLTGKYSRGVTVDSARSGQVAGYFNERGYRTLGALDAVAKAHGVPVSAVALAWLAQQPTVLAPIASARTPEQFSDLLTLKTLTLTDDELQALREAAA